MFDPKRALPALLLLAACGGAPEPTIAPPAGGPGAGQGVASSQLPAAPEAPGAEDDWATRFTSEWVTELAPPPVASLAERARTDEARLDEILREDLPSLRARVTNLRRRLSLRPDDVAVRLELGELYYQNELPNLAEVQLLTVLEADGHQGVAHKLLADVYRQAGDQGRAAWHGRRAHRDLPLDSTVLFLWGWTLRDAGDLEVAMAVAEAGLEIDPADARVLVLLAMLRADDGRYEEAVELARRGIAANPDHLRGHSVLGQALIALGREEEGQAEMVTHRRLLLLNSAKLLDRQPPLEEWHRAAALAHYHHQVGRLDMAREELARSNELLPGNPAAVVVEARIAVSEGDEARAFELLEGALAASPNEPFAAGALGKLLVTATDASRRDYPRALQLAASRLGRGGEQDFEVLFTLGVAEAELGYELQARRHLEAALELQPADPLALAALDKLLGSD
jgi:tetratricopeptide (TPR) repeat protein